MRAADNEFRAAWKLAYEEGTDLLEEEAQRRAVDGVPDFRLDRHGNKQPFVRYSDTLLMFAQKARQPEKCRDNSIVKHRARAPTAVACRGAPGECGGPTSGSP